MSKSTIFIVLGGFVFAFLAAVGVQLVMGGKSESKNDVPTVQILVAAADVKLGEPFGSGNVRWENWPENRLIEGAIVREGDAIAATALKGKARRDFSKGEPLTDTSTVDDTGKTFITASMEPGMRAVSIKVKAETSVSGLASPGDRVDVLVKYDVRLPDDERIRNAATTLVTRSVAETLLEDIRILAVDQNTKKASDPKLVKTMTLEVTPKQAEILQVAEGMGDLILTLRSGADAGKGAAVPSKQATTDIRVSRLMHELMGGQGATPTRTVRLYQGNSVQNVEVRP